MDIAYNLLKRSLENHEVDYVFITSKNDEWILKTWRYAEEEFVDEYSVSKEIRIESILTFLPHDGITFKSDIKEVSNVIKEMNLNVT